MDNKQSLQDLQAPEVKFKDRKILMLLYDGKLKNPEKLRRLLRLGYVTVRDGEYVPTIVGSLLIDFTVRERNKADARRQAKKQNVGKGSRISVVENQLRDYADVLDGQLDVGDSGEVVDVSESSIGEVGGRSSDLLLADVRTDGTVSPP